MYSNRLTLPCGCAPCGCVCPAHSLSGREDPCPEHAELPAIVRWAVLELGAITALGLFVCCAVVWIGIFQTWRAPL